MWIVDVEFRSKLQANTDDLNVAEKKKNTTIRKEGGGRGTSYIYIQYMYRCIYHPLRVRKTRRKNENQKY